MQELLKFAEQLADAAAGAIAPYFGNHGAVDAKSDASPVTQADRAAEAAMRALIEKHYPEHGIFGEEHGQKAGNRYTWVLDPIDGTRAFIAGGKEWGTLIALCDDGVPVLGVLNQPITNERWLGAREMQSLYNGEPIAVRACPRLSDATLSSTSTNYFTPEQAGKFVKLADACAEVVKDGDCYAYGLLARGLRDVVVDAGLKPYDILALVPIIHGAGGDITAWDGSGITLLNFATALAAGDAELHYAAMHLLGAGRTADSREAVAL